MISMIENNCVERKKWITHDDDEVTVIAEPTPGPIAINCATFTRYKKAGFIGALVATLGMVLPSFEVIYLISMFLDNFLEQTTIANAFKVIKIDVGILILHAAVTMIKKMHKKKVPRAILICSCAVMLCINIFVWNFSSISLILIAAVVSLRFLLSRAHLSRKVVVSESTPGPIMVNMATYVGSNQAGFLGAVVATLEVALPSFSIILLVTALLKSALKNKYVQAVLRGLKPCVIRILLATGIYNV